MKQSQKRTRLCFRLDRDHGVVLIGVVPVRGTTDYNVPVGVVPMRVGALTIDEGGITVHVMEKSAEDRTQISRLSDLAARLDRVCKDPWCCGLQIDKKDPMSLLVTVLQIAHVPISFDSSW